MTCAAAYRLPRQYTLLAVDGRITDDHGVIYTDRAQKFCQAGCLVAAFAGDIGPIQDTIRSWVANTKSIDSVQAAMRLRPKVEGDKDWSAIAFDWSDDALYTCDSDGTVLRLHDRATAIGSGSEVAIGYLKARLDVLGAGRHKKRNWTTAQAKTNVRGAIRAAAARNSTVGPKSTVLECRPGGVVRVRG